MASEHLKKKGEEITALAIERISSNASCKILRKKYNIKELAKYLERNEPDLKGFADKNL